MKIQLCDSNTKIQLCFDDTCADCEETYTVTIDSGGTPQNGCDCSVAYGRSHTAYRLGGCEWRSDEWFVTGGITYLLSIWAVYEPGTNPLWHFYWLMTDQTNQQMACTGHAYMTYEPDHKGCPPGAYAPWNGQGDGTGTVA